MKSSSSLRFGNDGIATSGNATVMRQSVQVHICIYVARKYIHTRLARAYISQKKKACRLIHEVLLLNVSVSACKCQLEHVHHLYFVIPFYFSAGKGPSRDPLLQHGASRISFQEILRLATCTGLYDGLV